MISYVFANPSCHVLERIVPTFSKNAFLHQSFKVPENFREKKREREGGREGKKRKRKKKKEQTSKFYELTLKPFSLSKASTILRFERDAQSVLDSNVYRSKG